MKCECCPDSQDYEEVYVHSRCHISAPLWVALDSHHHIIRLICSQCEQHVGTLREMP